MLVALLLLSGVVFALWKRLGNVTAQLAELTLQHRELRRAHESLERDWRASFHQAPEGSPVTPDVPRVPPMETPAAASDAAAPPIPPAASAPPMPPPLAADPRTPGSETPSGATRGAPGSIDAFESAARTVMPLFTTGNVVAKAGVVVVFFGVAFLLRYAAERGMLPIEYRLMGTAAGAIVLLGIGWRLRDARRDYAVVLQGGAIGVLYLTIFAAFRLYGLIPASITFALLLMVVACSAALAVARNAMSLAVLGSSGGFLAPILASTESGDHVALFSYYAVLNAGVLAVAWFRAWRFLNWLAFVFTFGIGSIWGAQYYEPELFAATEPFLVFFFALFVAVSILVAHRQPPRLRGYIDGTLVFGTPAVAFGMQSVLVRDIPFGRAYSAVALTALYLALTRLLWWRDAALRPLAEAFLSLAVVFLVLAVPLAFDGHATAAAWALQGAGLVWLGIRQQRRRARLAGAALLLGAGGAFAVMTTASAATPVLNTGFVGGVAIAVASLVAGRLLAASRHTLGRRETRLEWVLLAWGLAWWFGIVSTEIVEHVATRFIPATLLLSLAVTAVSIAVLARRWKWRALMLAEVIAGPLSWAPAPVHFLAQRDEGPLPDLGWLAWLAVLVSNYLLLYWFERAWPPRLTLAWHAATTWLAIFLATWSTAAAVQQIVPEAPAWGWAAWALVPVLLVSLLRTGPGALAWPVVRFSPIYNGAVPAAVIAATLGWTLWACTRAGGAAPLPYIPLLNPLELAQGFVLLNAAAWWKATGRHIALDESMRSAGRALGALVGFVALNAVVARAVHFYLGVPFELPRLLDSPIFQTGISILWSVVAGLLMTLSRLRLDRSVWMAGAALLGALLVKLFLVDLGNVTGVARIVSFIVTGVLILLIGYLAPVPPRTTGPEREQTT